MPTRRDLIVGAAATLGGPTAPRPAPADPADPPTPAPGHGGTLRLVDADGRDLLAGPIELGGEAWRSKSECPGEGLMSTHHDQLDALIALTRAEGSPGWPDTLPEAGTLRLVDLDGETLVTTTMARIPGFSAYWGEGVPVRRSGVPIAAVVELDGLPPYVMAVGPDPGQFRLNVDRLDEGDDFRVGAFTIRRPVVGFVSSRPVVGFVSSRLSLPASSPSAT